ncbi:hypothetical protein [Kitasatospora brasiliensis]|uniref:hypothetical protein n=1 Tax=Kitasatospora brasiliensis TaxID=3058040 RepID=UPI002930E259|nr:hypothetical protein [Kitasatospora sp. K002]
MSGEERTTSGGFHISGSGNINFTNSPVAAGRNSSVTVNSGAGEVDEEALARRVLALAERLRRESEPGSGPARTAEDLQAEVDSPARRWDQVRRFLQRARDGVVATTAMAAEIRQLEETVESLLS